MAYANNYSYMYGFSLLDDLHNFFPELLYDESLFPEQRFGWFRHRTSTLFPNVFPRQMNMYQIYSAAERQRMFQEWVASQAIGVASSQQNINTRDTAPNNAPAVQNRMPSAAAVVGAHSTTPIRTITTLQYASPVRRAYSHSQAAASLPSEMDNSTANSVMSETPAPPAPQTPQRPPVPVHSPAPPLRRGVTGRGAAPLRSDVDILTALFTLPTVPINNTSLFGTNELLSLLTNGLNFQDVLVVPTLDQIDAASRIILHTNVPEDENCTICQEHTIPGQQSPWRRLHCSHQFHTSCIMSWFQRDVHCPVCRADIRELEDETGTGSTSTPSDEMSISSSETTENPPAPTSQH